MSDRSYFQLHIYGFERVEDLPWAVEELITSELGLDLEWVRRKDIRFVAEEMGLGAYEEIGEQLIGVDPRLMFQCWNDPKYEYMGGLFRYTPHLGRFQHDSDSRGSPMFSAEEVMAIVSSGSDLESLLGLPWVQAFKPFQGAYTEAP